MIEDPVRRFSYKSIFCVFLSKNWGSHIWIVDTLGSKVQDIFKMTSKTICGSFLGSRPVSTFEASFFWIPLKIFQQHSLLHVLVTCVCGIFPTFTSLSSVAKARRRNSSTWSQTCATFKFYKNSKSENHDCKKSGSLLSKPNNYLSKYFTASFCSKSWLFLILLISIINIDQ